MVDYPYELHLLGGFALLRSGGAVPVPISLQRIVAFLALRGPTPRRATAGVLWPSTCDEKAMASLRTAVWRLRRMADGLLNQPGDLLALDPSVTIDVAVVERTARPCTELLPGWYDDWVIMDRERLRHWHIRLLEAAAAAAIEKADLNAAVDWALAAVASDPLRESAHRLVITALLADGNVGAARRHLTLVRNVFREQLGIAPSAQLSALFENAPV
ncbi:AfsR/SARP family transcriptional regulator [Actinoplanes solisilvae]|uniref:AfsR/SARP family transcriptional regulator n=1 Tax=Actinoplanes solisilvae TaxID=2486853 RepID=UPI0013E2CD1A|nr:BTAD domain-containing putative transcriptional regulator [Actinoplanes solisilvae]